MWLTIAGHDQVWRTVVVDIADYDCLCLNPTGVVADGRLERAVAITYQHANPTIGTTRIGSAHVCDHQIRHTILVHVRDRYCKGHFATSTVSDRSCESAIPVVKSYAHTIGVRDYQVRQEVSVHIRGNHEICPAST